MKTSDLIVVGGGPAGMMAAGRAAERGRRVVLLERGAAPGRKLLLTGGGRCNMTNTAPLEDALAAFGRRGGSLRNAFAAFGPADLLSWFRDRGVETVEERKGRVFPKAQNARVVLDALLDYMKAGGVCVETGRRVEALLLESGRAAGVVTGGLPRRAGSVLVATGGLSYPATGSTGDGFALARQAGHRVTPPFPAIVAFETDEAWPRRLQGTPLKNVSITIRREGRRWFETFGEALWTHYGISGPAILDVSRDLANAMRRGERLALEVDLRPNDTEQALDQRLLLAIRKEGKKQVSNVLGAWMPLRTASVLLETEGLDPRKKMNQCSKADRKRIVRFAKRLTLHLARPRPVEEAIVTGGGVALEEIDPRRLESRLAQGLHFAGEVLDLDGPCGGFNLQAAFSTGYLVGEVV